MVVRNAMIRLKAQGLVDGVPGVAVFVSTGLPDGTTEPRCPPALPGNYDESTSDPTGQV